VFGADAPAWYTANETDNDWKKDYRDGYYEANDDSGANYNFFVERRYARNKLEGRTHFDMQNNDQTDPIYLMEIQVIKGKTNSDGDWRTIVGDGNTNFFGILVGKIPTKNFFDHWYVIEEYVKDIPSLTQNLKPKTILKDNLKTGFYEIGDINRQIRTYSLRNDAAFEAPDCQNIFQTNHPIYIKNIEINEEKGIYVGQLIDEKFLKVAHSKNETEAQHQFIPNKQCDFEKSEAENGNLKRDFDKTKDELDTAVRKLKVESDQQKEIDSLKKWRWGLGFTVVFFVCLSGYLIWLHYFKKQELENDEDDENEFDIGDRVRVRDSKKQDWLFGEVMKLNPIKVRVDNWEKARKWKYIEYVEPSSIKVEKKPIVKQVKSPSPPKEKTPPPKEKTPPPKQVQKPRTIIIEPDNHDHMWHNSEASQKDGTESPTPTISEIETANFSTLESLSDIPSNFSYFTTGLTEEIENVSTLTDLSDATASHSNQQDLKKRNTCKNTKKHFLNQDMK
jgi:hypothetical protein